MTAVTDDVHRVAARALDDIGAATTLEELEQLRARYLGRRDGELSSLLRGLGRIEDAEARAQFAKTAQELNGRVAGALDDNVR